ncbi:uncharacterized protein LOC143302089 [Babylonia areolata]|uniref:uncharacterized protein LOC143302089 n=1 Tax=Babylonia areolata TaxID=304850 RepID=UPI003FCEE909
METMTTKLWWCLFILCSSYTNSEVHTAFQMPSSPPCFLSCVCKNTNQVFCAADKNFTAHINDFNSYLLSWLDSEMRPQVHFETQTDNSLPEFLPRLPVLHYLSLAENQITFVQSSVLRGMRLHKLNLSHNEIQSMEGQAFQDLHYLQMLDLSHNQLSSISKFVFADLPNLRVLNLDNNRLINFPLGSFSNVPRLETLRLNNNKLSYLMPGALIALSSLRFLALRNNSLWSLAAPVKDEIPNLEFLDVSVNPFHCSCATAGLRSIVDSSSLVLSDIDRMDCFTPLSFRGQRVVDVVMGLQECRKPSSVHSYDSETVLYLDDVHVSCDVQGDPDPAILWLTPWGDQFADPSHLPRLESLCSSCRHQRHYSNNAVSYESTVSVTRGGKSLHISNFRGFFNGNITCWAYNYLGNDTTIHQVAVLSPVQGAVQQSMQMGAFSAAGFLCLGLMVGSIKLLLQACLARFGKKQKVVRTPTTTALLSTILEEPEEEGSMCREHSVTISDDFDTPPGSPLTPHSPHSSSSPYTLLTPNEGQGTPTGSSARHASSNILETMEEVRWRLRHGVGRRMQSVKRNVASIRESGRRNVASIRESGSLYMHNIKETGTTAASKVKAGVVMGMVTVKSHVQSIREFCGTGDMGSHTISAISMETDLDTNETKEVVRSVTIV